jgi:hypothetical protein
MGLLDTWLDDPKKQEFFSDLRGIADWVGDYPGLVKKEFMEGASQLRPELGPMVQAAPAMQMAFSPFAPAFKELALQGGNLLAPYLNRLAEQQREALPFLSDRGEVKEFTGEQIATPLMLATGLPRGKVPKVLLNKVKEPNAVSTRFPTAVKRTEDPHKEILTIGLNEAKQNPGLFSHNTALTRNYPNIRSSKSRSADNHAEEFVEHAKDNLLWLWDNVPDQTKQRSMKWYDGANKVTTTLADQHQLPHTSAAGVMAAMSPQKDWFMNADLGRRVIDTYATQQSTPFNDDMFNTAITIYSPKKFGLILDGLRNKTFAELETPKEKAIWLRIFDETYNDRSYNIISAEGDIVDVKRKLDGMPAKVAWGSNQEIANAIKMLDSGGDLNIISDALGQMHKVRNFYNNIALPNSPNGYVTVDTHAVAGALLRPLSGKDREVAQMLGGGIAGEGRNSKGSAISGVQGLYAWYADAYRRAAAERGVLPRQLQSVTWEAIRGMFSPTFKGQKKNKVLIDGIWQGYKDNKYDIDEARNRIISAAGGINNPEWEL